MKILRLPAQQFYELNSRLQPPSREELPLTCPNFLIRLHDTLVVREDRAEFINLLDPENVTLAQISRLSVTGVANG